MPFRTKYLDAKSSRQPKANHNNPTSNKQKSHLDARAAHITTTHLRVTDEQGTGTDRGDAATACWNSIPYRPARDAGLRSARDPRGGDGPRSCPPPLLPRRSGTSRRSGGGASERAAGRGEQSTARLSADARRGRRPWWELECAEPRSAPGRLLRGTANPALLRLVSEEKSVESECLSDEIGARAEGPRMVCRDTLLSEAKAEGEERWRRLVASADADISSGAEMAGEEGGAQRLLSQKDNPV